MLCAGPVVGRQPLPSRRSLRLSRLCPSAWACLEQILWLQWDLNSAISSQGHRLVKSLRPHQGLWGRVSSEHSKLSSNSLPKATETCQPEKADRWDGIRHPQVWADLVGLASEGGACRTRPHSSCCVCDGGGPRLLGSGACLADRLRLLLGEGTRPAAGALPQGPRSTGTLQSVPRL